MPDPLNDLARDAAAVEIHKPLYPWWRRGRRRLWTVRIAVGLAGLLLSLAAWWVHEQYMRVPWTW